jgi:WD40 repeat protein
MQKGSLLILRMRVQVLFGCSDSKIKIWNVQLKRPVLEVEETNADCPRSLCTTHETVGHIVLNAVVAQHRILDLASSPTSATFVSAAANRYYDKAEGGKGVLSSWDLTTGRLEVHNRCNRNASARFRLDMPPTAL